MSPCDLVCLFFGQLAIGFYIWTKSWIFNNIVATLFCLHGMQSLSMGTFKNGFLLLTLLFFYDIFFVFGTDIMLTVAKGIDAPIKLLFPRDWYHEDGPKFALLGLGDIVMPGFFIALCLRYDIVMTAQAKLKKDSEPEANLKAMH